MPARIPDDRRAAVRAAIESRDGRSRAQIAREFDVGPGTVKRIADEAGIEQPWDTRGTREATVAARDRLRAKRAAVSARFLDEVDRLLDKVHAPYVVHAFGGKDNEFNAATLAEPDAAAIRNLMTSAAVAFDKHLAADKHDQHDDADDAVSMLGRLADGFAAAHAALSRGAGDEQLDDDEPDDEEIEP